MATERQVKETVALCVSCMVFYVNSGKTRQAKGMIITEVQAAERLFAQWGLSDDSLSSQVEAEMGAGFGPADGHNLSREFAEVLKGLTGSDPMRPSELVV